MFQEKKGSFAGDITTVRELQPTRQPPDIFRYSVFYGCKKESEGCKFTIGKYRYYRQIPKVLYPTVLNISGTAIYKGNSYEVNFTQGLRSDQTSVET